MEELNFDAKSETNLPWKIKLSYVSKAKTKLKEAYWELGSSLKEISFALFTLVLPC